MELSDLAIFAAVAKCGGITRAATQVNTAVERDDSRASAGGGDRRCALRAAQPRRHPDGRRKAPAPHAERLASMSREPFWRPVTTASPRAPWRSARWKRRRRFGFPRSSHDSTRTIRSRISRFRPPRQRPWRSVLDGHLDGAFVAGPIEHPDLVAIRAFSEELVLITASRWRRLSALQQAKRATGLTISCSEPDARIGRSSSRS